MRSTDHPRAGIDKQYRPAVGCGDADGEAFGPRHDGIGARARRGFPWSSRDRDIRRMNLERGEKVRRRDAQLYRHAPAVLDDVRGIVLRTHAAIETLVDSAGHAALAAEK